MMIVCGIDPGLQGGIALLMQWPGAKRPEVKLVARMPLLDGRIDARQVRVLVSGRSTCRPGLVVLERVASAPGQGNASGFRFGHAAGVVEGVAACCSDRVELVTPSVWKSSYRLAGGAARKAEAVALAARLVGQVDAMTDGMAEAVLIAWWGLQHLAVNAD